MIGQMDMELIQHYLDRREKENLWSNWIIHMNDDFPNKIQSFRSFILTERACGAGSFANFLCLSRSVNIHLLYMCHVGQCLVRSPERESIITAYGRFLLFFFFILSRTRRTTGFSFLLINLDCDRQVTFCYFILLYLTPEECI
jgi:hypothetical protein